MWAYPVTEYHILDTERSLLLARSTMTVAVRPKWLDTLEMLTSIFVCGHAAARGHIVSRFLDSCCGRYC